MEAISGKVSSRSCAAHRTFVIGVKSSEASTRSVAQDLWPKAFPLPPATQTVTGDSEKSRSRSLRDKYLKPPGGNNENTLIKLP